MNFLCRIFGCILTLFFIFGRADGEIIKIKDENKNISRLAINLNGKWSLEPSLKKTQVRKHSIVVPGLVDMAQPPINWQSYNCFWYKKTFTLTPSRARSHAFIKINQSQYGTEVWLNEKYLGGYMGCYTSHEYDATDAINYNGENNLIVKVGSKDSLSKIGAVGHDYEKISFIPGIWGDVSLNLMGSQIIERVHVIPHIDTSVAEARITLKNLDNVTQDVSISSAIFEKSTGNTASDEITLSYTISPLEEKTLTVNLPVSNMKLWSPGNPFLYQLVSKVKIGEAEEDALATTFGMREFKIIGSDFYLNSRRAFLKGGNIAFHRFLSDPDRKELPWNEAWIKKILIDIPKAHNFNFFRNHLGQMYNKWYDIADEYGMMFQNEWAFWKITGREGQIKKEFTQWLYDNWNHPSIIIWDAMNEPHDDGEVSREIIRDKIIPAMKLIDPTRPWECGLNTKVDFKPGAWKPVDFSEDHPYIYLVLVD
jgi:beta-galactosidase